ncbi:MAG TPA: bacterial transcriptional activator domain-containing protein [Verrucomicrobiae bacterium]|nr:bacterial transcriptional activator domain-containing protein [Verrucomicrobiae bacterium]
MSYPRAAASREVLVGAFWPALDAESALHRLHLAAAGARAALRALSPELDGIRCNGGAYAWRPGIVIDSDVELLLGASRGTSIADMERAAASYSGEFLAGEEAEWMYPLRVRCANAYAIILERLAEDQARRAQWGAALEYALRLVETDRAHEGATRLAMRALGAMGRRGAALAVYDALAAYLQRHLMLQPSAETCALRGAIIAGDA